MTSPEEIGEEQKNPSPWIWLSLITVFFGGKISII